jgi:hypothetical protein
MTAAAIRQCNGCKKPFVKEDGCNRMYCSCRNSQCFVCSATVTDYTHFSVPNGCPLNDDTSARIKSDVMEAQAQAIKKSMTGRHNDLEGLTVDRYLLPKPMPQITGSPTQGFVKPANHATAYFPESWLGEDPCYTSGYNTTPYQDSGVPFITPAWFNPPSAPYHFGQFDVPYVYQVPDPIENQYKDEEGFGKLQICVEPANTHPTPRTVVQEIDQRGKPSKGGNNPFGSKGTRACASCRKRKGRVIHLNRRGLTVVRIQGPRYTLYVVP